MRNLLDLPGERIFFKDLESRFLVVSRGWLEDLAPGWSPEEIVGKSDADIFSEPHADAAFEDEQRIIRTGEPIVGKVECETFRNRPDIWVSTTKFPLKDDAGRIVGSFGISRDVTAQILAEQALTFQSLHDTVTGLANRRRPAGPALPGPRAARAPDRDRSRCCSSTSTTSRRSTTPSATRPATRCSSRWPGA